MKTAQYKRESRKWNFKKYVRVHMDQHQILTDLKEHAYAGIDDSSKVQYLQEGIQTSALDSVKNAILVFATLRSDFTTCVSLYQDFIFQASTASENQSLMIDTVETGGRGDGSRGGRGGRGG